MRDLNGVLEADGKGPAAELLVEGAILHLRADLEWLELIELRLALRRRVYDSVLEASNLAKL